MLQRNFDIKITTMNKRKMPYETENTKYRDDFFSHNGFILVASDGSAGKGEHNFEV